MDVYTEIEELIEALKSDDYYDRKEACDLLRKADGITPDALKALKRALRDPEDSVVRAAQKALDAHPSPELPQVPSLDELAPEPNYEAKDNIQKWEHRWEFVFLEAEEYVLIVGERELTGQYVWNYLASLGKDGWELVTVAPQIGDTNPNKRSASTAIASMMDFAIAGPRITTMSQHRTGTTGYFFWYKRPANS